MKKSVLFVLIICSLSLSACNRYSGKVDNCEITVGESVRFSQEEMRAAMDKVLEKFPNFSNCELTELWYDEEGTNHLVDLYITSGRGKINGITREHVIILYSNFNTGEKNVNDGLNHNSRYTNWNWILVRENADSEWRINDMGY